MALGKSEIRSAGAASPRIDSGTYENSNRCEPGWTPELWLIGYKPMSSTYRDSAAGAPTVSEGAKLFRAGVQEAFLSSRVRAHCTKQGKSV